MLLNLFTISTNGVAENQYEHPPILKASQLLDKKLLENKLYTIQESIVNNGYTNIYKINSEYGDYEARGKLELEERIREIAILRDIKINFPSGEVAQEAATKTGENIITAPIRAINKATETISNPTALKKTVSKVPGGVKNLFKLAASTIGSGTEFVYETGKSAVGASDTSTADHLEEASEFITDKVLDYSGYNQATTQLMQKYGINPYTTNEFIKSEVRRVATIQSSIGVSSKFIPGIPNIPGVSEFNKYIDTTNKISAYEKPEKLEELNRKILKVLEKHKDSDPAFGEILLKNNSYTPLTRSALLQNLQKFGNISGINDFIIAASKAKDSEVAIFYLLASNRLLKIHQTNSALTRIIVEANLPAGLDKNNTLYIPLPVDYLTWTKEVSSILVGFKERIIKNHQTKINNVEIIIAGSASQQAQKELKNLGASNVLINQGYMAETL